MNKLSQFNATKSSNFIASTNLSKQTPECDEVFTGSGRYPWQVVPAKYFLTQQENEQ